VVDNLATGCLTNLNPAVIFYNLDIACPQLKKVFAREKPQVVVHQAAQVSVDKSARDVLLDANANIIGSINLFENCLRFRVKRILYASTAAIYGDPEYLPIDENHPVNPVSFYGVSKHTPENYLRVFACNYGMSYAVLRYANVYGPRQAENGEGGVISVFIRQLLSGIRPTIYGDGLQTRDFIFVDDGVSQLQAMFLSTNFTVNISTNQTCSIDEAYTIIRKLIEPGLEPSYQKARPGDIIHSRLNNQRARDILHWQPHTTLQQGLEKTIAYERDKLAAG
jgi:UDP-glucose 4-epimerase